MKIDLKNYKGRCIIIGMQGSGKTELSKEVIKQFKTPLVYGVYPQEWSKEGKKITIYEPHNFSIEHFNHFAGELIKEQEKNKTFDALFVDDADLFFNANYSRFNNINRLFISQRQLGLSIVLISKRPQNLTPKVYENSDYIIVFAVEGVNVKKYLKNLHENMEMLLPNLSREKHNFVIKKIGEKPVLLSKINKTKSKEKPKNARKSGDNR